MCDILILRKKDTCISIMYTVSYKQAIFTYRSKSFIFINEHISSMFPCSDAVLGGHHMYIRYHMYCIIMSKGYVYRIEIASSILHSIRLIFCIETSFVSIQCIQYIIFLRRIFCIVHKTDLLYRIDTVYPIHSIHHSEHVSSSVCVGACVCVCVCVYVCVCIILRLQRIWCII